MRYSIHRYLTYLKWTMSNSQINLLQKKNQNQTNCVPVDHFMPTTEFIRSINIVVVFFSVIIISFHRLYDFRTDDVDINNNSIYYFCKVSNVRRTRPHAEGIDATARGIHTSLFAIRRTTTTVRLARLRGGTPLKSTSVLPPRAHRRPRLNSFVRLFSVVGRSSSLSV